MQKLDKTDYSFATKKDLHLLSGDNRSSEKINRLLADRAAGNGLRGQRNLSDTARQRAIYNRLMPNRKTVVARHGAKLFCGTYSTCGNFFMSAAQGEQHRIIIMQLYYT